MKIHLKILLLSLFLLPAISLQAQDRNNTDSVLFSATIHCDNCILKIENRIPFEKGVRDVKVDLANKQVKVYYDPSRTDVGKIQAAFKKIKVETEVMDE